MIFGFNLFRIALSGIFIFVLFQATGQTFNSTQGDSIPDNGTWIEFPIMVSGLSQNLGSDFGLESVCFSIQHSYVSDLQIVLVSPWNKQLILVDGVGGNGHNFENTVLGNISLPSLNSASAPFTGNFRAQQSLGLMNKGESGNGIWKLKIRDTYPVDKGFLQNWCIKFSDQPAGNFPFLSSNLPVIIVSTGNQTIVDEPKTPGYLQFLNRTNGARNYLSDSVGADKIPMGIEIRGSSSQGFPKKSYGFEIKNNLGQDSSLSILGLPPESDWILSANYSDKSFLRNAFAYYLARQMGSYAPRTKFVELVVNEEYQGIYVLTEKIKRNTDRVDISKLKPEDTTGNDLTGGYIIKIDKSTGGGGDGFYSQFLPQSHGQGQKVQFLFDYPKGVNLHPLQKSYIQSFVDSFETAVNSPDFTDPVVGYRRFADLPSFFDMLLINEWSKNTDGYRISTYLTKPKITQNGGKLKAGPIWDYDLAWRNANYCGGESTSGWEYNFPTVCPDDGYQPPNWWKRFRTDPEFNNTLNCRWNQLINDIMPLARRTNWIDSVRVLLDEAQQRNFAYWPILGHYVWPNPDPIPTTYAGEVQAFKNWISNRQNWINNNIGGTCLVGIEKSVKNSNVQITPNPANGVFRIEGLGQENSGKILIFNSVGQSCGQFSTSEASFDIQHLPSGLYFLYLPGKHPEVFKLVKE